MSSELNENKIFMFSSVHVWMDTRIFNKELKSLADAGKTIDYYAIESQKIHQEINIPKLVTLNLLPISTRLKRFKRWNFLLNQALLSDAKYYHFHDPELLYVAKKLKKLKPKSIIIYDMHEYFPGQLATKEWIPFFFRFPASQMVKLLEKKWMNSCDGVIFAESSYLQHHLNYQGAKETILNYPLWKEYQKKNKSSLFTLIYVGDITEDRNIWGMIELVKTLKARGHEQFQLKLIGSIQPNLKEHVEKIVFDYGISDYVHWYGRIPYEEIWEHYFSADIGLCLLHPIPNYKNSLATKLFEYMAAGLPIVASNFPDWKKLVADSTSGMTVDPLDNEQIVAAIEEIKANQKIADAFSENGRHAFEKKYNWKTEEKKLLSFYKHLSD